MIRTTRGTSCARVTVLLAALVLLLSTGCIYTRGESSGKRLARLRKAEIFLAAELYYPDGVLSEDPSRLPELDASQVRQVQLHVQRLMDYVNELGEGHRSRLQRVFGNQFRQGLTTRVVVLNSGLPVAHSETDGRVTIDIVVLQTVFRSVLLHMLREDRRGGGFFSGFMTWPDPAEPEDHPASPRTEIEMLRSFFELKRDIEQARGRSILGDLLSSNAPGQGSFGKSLELEGQLLRFSNRYASTLMFLLGHEQGHLALGHHLTASRSESEFKAREMDADAYSVLLLSLTQPHPMFAWITEPGSMEGYRMFLDITYATAGFTDYHAQDGFAYPAIGDRLHRAEEIHKEAERAKWDAMLQPMADAMGEPPANDVARKSGHESEPLGGHP